MVNGEKHEREKKSQTCQIYSGYPMRNLRYTYAKCIYNRRNLPFWLITRCWWEAAAAVGCFQDKYESLGSRRGEHFLVSKDFSCYHPPWSPRQLCEGRGASSIVILFNCSAQLHASSMWARGPKAREGGGQESCLAPFVPPPCWSGGPMVPRRGGLGLEPWRSAGFSKVAVSTDDTSPRAAHPAPNSGRFWAMGFISLERLSWNFG